MRVKKGERKRERERERERAFIDVSRAEENRNVRDDEEEE